MNSEKRLDEILSFAIGQNFAFGKATGEEKVEITPEVWKQMQIDMYNNSQGNLNEVDGYNCDICRNKGFPHHFFNFSIIKC